MKLSKPLIFLVFTSVFLFSCGSKKKLAEAEMNEESVSKIIQLHKSSETEFKTLQARLRADYKDEKDNQSIAVSMRMEKDKTIWLSAKLAGIIPLAKVKITPEKVQYYEKVNGTYFDGDFRLLSNWLGTDLDFQKVQNLLIGQSIYDLSKEKYQLETSEEGYLLVSALKKELQKMFVINPSNYRINTQQLTRAKENQDISIKYKDYQEVAGKTFPQEIGIRVHENEKQTEIDINYRSVEFDQPVSFPFEIPSGYKEIIIE